MTPRKRLMISLSIWFHNLFREFTMNQSYISRIHCKFSKSPSINYLFRKITIYYANSFWIHCLFLKFTICSAISLSFWLIYFGFIIFFGISRWIHWLLWEIILNFTSFVQMNYWKIIFSRIYYEFTYFFSIPHETIIVFAYSL